MTAFSFNNLYLHDFYPDITARIRRMWHQDTGININIEGEQQYSDIS